MFNENCNLNLFQFIAVYHSWKPKNHSECPHSDPSTQDLFRTYWRTRGPRAWCSAAGMKPDFVISLSSCILNWTKPVAGGITDLLMVWSSMIVQIVHWIEAKKVMDAGGIWPWTLGIRDCLAWNLCKHQGFHLKIFEKSGHCHSCQTNHELEMWNLLFYSKFEGHTHHYRHCCN
jgi:hypothetical protein